MKHLSLIAVVAALVSVPASADPDKNESGHQWHDLNDWPSYFEGEREARKHYEELGREAAKHHQEIWREHRKHQQELERESFKRAMEIERERYVDVAGKRNPRRPHRAEGW